MVLCGLCGFLIIKPQTTLFCGYGAIQFCYFVGGFGAVFAVCEC